MERVFFVRDLSVDHVWVSNDLWVTDGTVGGTHRVGLANAQELAHVDGALFVGVGSNTPTQLSVVDPTTEQTTFLANIGGGFGDSGGMYMDRPAVLNGELFFHSSSLANGLELWHSDGTPEGTGLLKDLRPGTLFGSPLSSFPGELTTIGDAIYFRAGNTQGSELWRSDGTAAGTVQVKDIRPGGAADGSTPLTITDVNGRAFFQADDGVHGWELWVSDGTAAGTTMVRDISPGSEGGLFRQTFAVLDGVLIFGAKDPTHGSALWRSDGTEAGTVMIAEINPGPGNAVFSSQFITFGDAVYFAANDGVHGTELWRTDGTESGTFMVADIDPSGSGWPGDFIAAGETLFFSADDGVHGKELWKLDGTGASLVADLNPGPGSTQIYSETVADGILFFTSWAVDEAWNVSLWRSDGTANGTFQLADSVDYNVDLVTTENNGVTGGPASDNLTGTESGETLSGKAGNDYLTGLGGTDLLVGGSGADVLDGGTGIDDMRGGAGSDLYYVHDTGDIIIEDPGADLDYVIAYATYTLPANVEAIYAMDGAGATGNGDSNLLFGAYAQHGLTLDGAGGSDIIYGTLYADTLIGGPGADALYGLDGDDTMQGGTGDDTFYVDQAGDGVLENPGEGDDKVYAQVDYTLAPNVEVLWTYGAATSGTGNGDANALLGVSSLHGLTLDGAGGNDTVYGSHFNDTLIGGEGDDVLWGYGGDDIMRGGIGNDVYLVADAGDVVEENPGEGGDIIYASVNITLPDTVEHLFVHGAATSGTGNAGDNYIVNAFISTGVTLTGAGGNDTFVFVPGMANGVTITDFDGNGTGAGDALQFAAYGPGATFTNIDPTHWQVNYGASQNQHDVITFSNGAAIDPGDFLFR